MHLKKLSFKNSHQISVSLYQCLNRRNVNEEVIKAKSVTSKISERFNLFEHLESFNDTFIKCKSQNNKTLKKVCSKDEYVGLNKTDSISCKRNYSIHDVSFTKGYICRDLQFLKNMNYSKDSISYVESKLFSKGKKRLNINVIQNAIRYHSLFFYSLFFYYCLVLTLSMEKICSYYSCMYVLHR